MMVRPLTRDECESLAADARDALCECKMLGAVCDDLKRAVDQRLHAGVPDGLIAHWGDLPSGARVEIEFVFNDLRLASLRTIGVFRWRRGQVGPHQPLRWVSFSCSSDGIHWAQLDYRGSAYAYPSIHVGGLDDQMATDVQSLLDDGVDQPYAWGLFDEAWELRRTDARSSLLLAYAAAEVAFKTLVAELAPDASWLVHELQSPPLEKMLRHYLPELPAKLRLNGQVVAPPKPLLDQVRRATELRNQVAHRQVALNQGELYGILLAIHQVLWLLEYYRGIPWALEMLLPTTREAMHL